MSLKLKIAQIKFPVEYSFDVIDFFIKEHGRLSYKDKLITRDAEYQTISQHKKYLKMNEEDKICVEKNFGDDVANHKVILVFTKEDPEIVIDLKKARGAASIGKKVGRPKKKICQECSDKCIHKKEEQEA